MGVFRIGRHSRLSNRLKGHRVSVSPSIVLDGLKPIASMSIDWRLYLQPLKVDLFFVRLRVLVIAFHLVMQYLSLSIFLGLLPTAAL